jgi:hypothetical protein
VNERKENEMNQAEQVRAVPAAVAAGFAALSVWLAVHTGVARLISESGGLDDAEETGVNRALSILRDLEDPAIAIGVAVIVLGLIAGGVMLAIGSPRGNRQVGFAVVGGLVLAAAGGVGK